MSVCVSVCVCRTICTTHYPATPLTYTGALIETSLKDDVALDTQTQPLFVLTRAACHNYTTAATVLVLVQYLHIALYGPLHPTPVLTLVCVCVWLCCFTSNHVADSSDYRCDGPDRRCVSRHQKGVNHKRRARWKWVRTNMDMGLLLGQPKIVPADTNRFESSLCKILRIFQFVANTMAEKV